MNRARRMTNASRVALALALLAANVATPAQDLLIRNATAHTASTAGTLRHTDVLVRAGKIAAIGSGLATPAGVAVVDASERPLTPGLFAGVSGIGIDEVSAEPGAHDTALAFGTTPPQPAQMRPEFDVTLAYNPRSSVLPVARSEGFTFTELAASSEPGGSILAGQGGPVRLDGSFEAPYAGLRALFVNLGGNPRRSAATRAPASTCCSIRPCAKRAAPPARAAPTRC